VWPGGTIQDGASAFESETMKQPFGKSVSFTEKLKKLRSVIGTRDTLAILVHADPDALASAMALKRLFWRRARRVDIYRVNKVARPDNRAFVRLLDIKHHHIQRLKKNAITKWALVDSQPAHHEAFAGIPFDIIIDHHPISDGLDAAFIDINPRYGSNATIMTEYLKAARIKPSPQLATALFYGIKSDTDNFVRNSISRDIIIFRYLYELANLNIIKKIESSELSLKALEMVRTAAENLSLVNETAFVHMGPVSSADHLVIVADFLMKLTETSWSVVSGTRSGKLVIIFRNAGIHGHAGEWARAMFGEIGSAGGHQSAARAEILLGQIAAGNCSDSDYGEFVRQHMNNNAAHALSV
jgi:nanoRNase/pAp phosphatase (c-di-AMP/oligoRNAs hydrolase)